MTLGAINLGDWILLMADGVVMHTNDEGAADRRESDVEKIWRHAKHQNVLWGFAGTQGVGLMFKRWFDGRSFASWDVLLGSANSQLAVMNGDASRLAKTADAEDHFQPATVLVAGYLGTAPEIAVIYSDGGFSREHSVQFVNGANVSAFAAWEALRRASAGGVFRPEYSFRLAMTVALDLGPALGGLPQELVAVPDAEA
jgi:hypothetical protein